MIFSDLPPPAEASSHTTDHAKGFAQAGNRYPLFGIMIYHRLDAAPFRSYTMLWVAYRVALHWRPVN